LEKIEKHKIEYTLAVSPKNCKVATLCSFFFLGARVFGFSSTVVPLYAVSFVSFEDETKGYLLPSGLGDNSLHTIDQ
jgi:hypothetical protein